MEANRRVAANGDRQATIAMVRGAEASDPEAEASDLGAEASDLWAEVGRETATTLCIA